jgi:Short C-terminal domain
MRRQGKLAKKHHQRTTMRYFILVPLLWLAGCMAAIFGSADQLNQLSIGMTKEQVIQKIGPPKSTAAGNGVEFMNDRWVKTVIAADGNFPEDYYVQLRNGKVIGFGRKGDFDTTSTPVQRVQIDQTVRQPDSANIKKDLYVELKKLQDLKDAGILTDDEFKARKKKLLDES